MSAKLQAEPKVAPQLSFTPARTGLAQRKCACGGSSAMAGGCAECGRKKRPVLQRFFADGVEPDRLLPSLAPPDSRGCTALGFGHSFARLQVQTHGPSEAQSEPPMSGPKSAEGAVRRVSATRASGGQPTAAPSLAQSPVPAGPTGEGAVADGSVLETASPDKARPADLIVEDEVRELGLGQMRKSEFLDELHGAVYAAADAELTSVGRTAQGCPYIEQWIAYYRTRWGGQIERAVRRYASRAAGTTTAQDYIPLVAERVRQGVAVWAATGRTTGVPQGVPSATPEVAPSGTGEGGGPRAKSEACGAVRGSGQESSGDKSLALKPRDAEGGVTDPEALQAQMGAGRPLDGGARSRMESAFGHDFSRVRVHTGGHAAGLAAGLHARAFTVGSDIAFGSGKYQPGTLVGDALLAHELAHVVQQGGATSPGGPMQKGGAEYDALEDDADRSAVGALASIWNGAKRGLASIGKEAMPRLKSGLRLARCKDGSKCEKQVPGATTCDQICDEAYKDSNCNQGGGGVICNGSTKCACIFDFPPLGLRKGECPELDAIGLRHEERHLPEVDCDPSKGLHRPPFKDPSKATASECTHRTEERDALNEAIKSAVDPCKAKMIALRDAHVTWIRANCGGGGP